MLSRRSQLASLLTSSLLLAQAPSVNLKAIRDGLDQSYPSLNLLYEDLHEHPELSSKEIQTGLKMAEQLRKLGFEVTTQVGGNGVGVLRNGQGPTLLIRTELDALPVEEKTGLACASLTPGVMHACGHDLHMTVWTGTATTLVKMKKHWHGTLLMVAQPAEETVTGARAMLADGFLTRFPKPDFSLALHDTPVLPAGTIGWVEGPMQANVDSVAITLFGRGGHGAFPETTVDPIVLATRVITGFQTIISREKSALEPGVITVGSIHGGTRPNIIPDEVKLQLTVRSFSPEVRKLLLDGITRIAKGEALMAGAPKEPLITFPEAQDACVNDPALTGRLVAVLTREMGADRILKGKPVMGAEDFGVFGMAAGAPSNMFWLGAVEPKRFAEAQAAKTPLPGLHSSLFAPDRERAVRTGIEAMVLSALDILGGKP